MATKQAKSSNGVVRRRAAGAPNGKSASSADADAASIDQILNGWRARLTGGIAPLALSQAYIDWAAHLAEMPERQAELIARAWSAAARVAACALTSGLPDADGGADSEPRDRRFDSAGWRQWPFNVISEAFLLSEDWWGQATTGVAGVSRHHQRMVSFWARQLIEAVSPANCFWSNPDVLAATVEQRGANLVRGAQLFTEDWQRSVAGEPPAGVESYLPGESVAITPGKVVYSNRLIELIQYEPTTEAVHPEPVLILSAPIMKYYILDLSPHNSMIRYLVDQGHTVFAVSWHNPTVEDRDLGMEDYRELGPKTALDAISAIVPERRVHAVGYCLGGTLMAIEAAAMARDGDERLRSITLFAAETDFSEPGEIGVFVDDNQIAELENVMRDQGYLDSKQMGGAFQMLRSYELIYSRIVEEYMLGNRRMLNDLMAWNADGTRLPYRMHSEYLNGMFLRNDLLEGRYLADGRPVTLSDIREPMFVVTTIKDHVAPWRTVYKLNLVAEAEVTMVLTSGGHNAGIVSEPGHPHRSFQCATRPAGAPYVDPERWAAETPRHDGSWWPVWEQWLTDHSSEREAPPPLGNPAEGYRPLADAPGKYILER
jgi:poly[(R)-3-hydroxyalkanoate] polymerase subunit PhaC